MMVDADSVIKTEFGEYITIPDGDEATVGEIIAYEIKQHRLSCMRGNVC